MEVPLPYVIDWPPKRLLVAACVVLGTFFAAAPAYADSCPIPPSSQVMAPLGDYANYSLLPGANFEGDMSGWTLSNASVTSGNEPWQVGGSGDSHSLTIGPGGYAISPPLCVSNAFPSWRFFANANGSSSLNVTADWSDNYGRSGVYSVLSLPAGSYNSWEPTPSLPGAGYLPDGYTVTVRLVFTAGSNTSWQIDDIYADPYAK